MIRKKRTRSGKLRYSPRVHVGGGRYQMLGTFDTEREAKTAEAKWTLKQGGGSNQRGGQFADFYLEGYAARVKASTFGTAQTAINRWREQFETRRLSTIDATEAEQWARENGWAAPAVVTMLNDAVRKGLIDRNPFKGLSKRGPGRRYLDPLTVDQVEELATIAEQHHGFGAFVRFTAYSGMRVGEVCGLEWGDVDFDRMRIMVRRRVYRGQVDLPKSGRVREIRLFPEARDALLAVPRKGDRIFRAKRGSDLTASTLAYYWQAISAVFGPVDPHELRHFAGHHLYVTMGLPSRVVGAQLGDTPRMISTGTGRGGRALGGLTVYLSGARARTRLRAPLSFSRHATTLRLRLFSGWLVLNRVSDTGTQAKEEGNGGIQISPGERAVRLGDLRRHCPVDRRFTRCALGTGGDSRRQERDRRRQRGDHLQCHDLGLGVSDPGFARGSDGGGAVCPQRRGALGRGLLRLAQCDRADRLVPLRTALGVSDHHPRRDDHLRAHGGLERGLGLGPTAFEGRSALALRAAL
ncbi:MAG TPA: tyrosine-type recombinase/integrase [Solirubrobacterales bacterium]